MTNDTNLSEDDARARFGELLDPLTGTYKVFDEHDAGVWRPELYVTPSGIRLRCYKLFPPVRPQGTSKWRRR